MIGTEWIYWVIGALFVAFGVHASTDDTNPRRIGSASFWALLGLAFGYSSFVVAKQAPDWLLGVVILVLTAIVGTKQLSLGTAGAPTETEQVAGADRLDNKLFVPALIIPVTAVVFAVGVVKITIGGTPLLVTGDQTLIGLAVGAILAVAAAMIMVRQRNLLAPVRAGGRLAETIGWALLLPQMLATLGVLFTTAGVGTAIGTVFGAVVPASSLIGSVIVYCVGMFLFTVIMGNAFAAFPIMTAAIGWPLLIQNFHGLAPAVFAIGMLSGFCGTLQTPMAANFNLVPAALLETKSRYAVIKSQSATGFVLLGVNIVLMYVICF